MTGNIQKTHNAALSFPREKFPARLPLDAAIAERNDYDIEFVLDRYNLSIPDYIKLKKDPIFKRKLEEYKERLSGEGEEFREVSKTLAQEFLGEMHRIVRDEATPASVKVKAISEMVRWAGYDPGTKFGSQSDSGQKFNIMINVGSDKDNVKVAGHKEEIKQNE